MKERLDRAERFINNDEPLTYTQAVTLMIGLQIDMWGEIESTVVAVPKIKERLSVLETRVTLGIGLSVIVGIIGAVALFLG